MAKASMPINRLAITDAEEIGSQALSLVLQAWHATGGSEKALAFAMVMDPAQFSRIKAGVGRLSLESVHRIPPGPFWSEYQRLVNVAKGLTPETEARFDLDRLKSLAGELIEIAARVGKAVA